jgi:hypothetical protein
VSVELLVAKRRQDENGESDLTSNGQQSYERRCQIPEFVHLSAEDASGEKKKEGGTTHDPADVIPAQCRGEREK